VRALGDALHRLVVLARSQRLLAFVALPSLPLASCAKELAQLHAADATTDGRAGLRREWYDLRSRSIERQREPREHHKVGMKPDAGEAANPKRGERVVGLQAADLAFHRDTATVEVAVLLVFAAGCAG